MARTRTPSFNPHTFLSEVGRGKTSLPSPNKHTIFSQGDASDAVFYIQAGKVKLTVVSQQGKEAVVAILERLRHPLTFVCRSLSYTAPNVLSPAIVPSGTESLSRVNSVLCTSSETQTL